MSANVLRERRRKLILDLKEHLKNAHNGTLDGESLALWLKELQKEFVNRMTAIEAAARSVVDDSGKEEDEGGMEGEQSDEDAETGNGNSMVDVDGYHHGQPTTADNR